MIANAFALSILTTSGIMFIYSKLPRKVRKFMEKHALLTDFSTLVAVYILFGGTLTALFAGAMVGIMVSIMLHIVQNPNDFLFLVDLRDLLKEKLVNLKQALNEYSSKYNENRVLQPESSNV